MINSVFSGFSFSLALLSTHCIVFIMTGSLRVEETNTFQSVQILYCKQPGITKPPKNLRKLLFQKKHKNGAWYMYSLKSASQPGNVSQMWKRLFYNNFFFIHLGYKTEYYNVTMYKMLSLFNKLASSLSWLIAVWAFALIE